MTETGQNDLITALTMDHRAVEGVFDELQQRDGGPQRRRDLADHMTAELMRHTVAAEQFLYPATRRSVPDGDRIVDRMIHENGRVEQLLDELSGVKANSARFDELVDSVVEQTRHHVEDEENNLFPGLRSALSANELSDLGEKIERTKQIAPTRPHPSTSKQPPANLVVASGAGLVDKIRDGLTGRAS